MTRGNQRDLARKKAAKKNEQAAKQKKTNETGANKGMSLTAIKERDAQRMREKQVQKDLKSQEGQGESSGATGGK